MKKKDKKTAKNTKRKNKEASKEEKGSEKRKYNLLIIDSDSRDWDTTFKGTNLTIDQCEWNQMIVQSDSFKRQPLINIRPNTNSLQSYRNTNSRIFQPDFVLVRKLVRGLNVVRDDYTNALYGLIFSQLPAVNSLLSIQQSLERPIVYAEMNKIKRRLGDEKFPLIPMTYYSNYQAMRFTPELPLVAKIGFAEAGFGKMKFTEQTDVEDFTTVVALHDDYVTLEKFVTNREYDIRIQKIGKHFRAYTRTNSNWKGNKGTCQLNEVQMNDKYQMWIDECAKMFGGMDILTVDAIHTKEGKDYILEINDTASGFAPSNQKQDMEHVKELVLQRIEEFYGNQ